MTEQNPEIKLSVSRTHHKDNEYSLTITIHNTHTSLDSHSYPRTPGNRSDLVIFGLTPDNILNLGNLITEQAFLVRTSPEQGEK